MVFCSDKKLLEGIRKKKSDSIVFMYKDYFPLILALVEHNSGSRQDAEDVFHDAMIVLYKRCRRKEFHLTCALRTFFYSVCKNIWMKRLERRKRLVTVPDFVVNEQFEKYTTEEDELKEDNLERLRLLYKHFTRIPEDCQKLLKLFIQKVPLKEIAKDMGFKDVTYAKTRKYLCKNMLRKRILRDPECQCFIYHE